MYVTEKCNHRSHTAAGCCCFSELLTEVCSKPQPVDATEWRWCGYLKLSLSATSLCHRDRVPTLLCFFRGPLADIVHALRTNPKDTNLASGPFPKSWLTNHEANHELLYCYTAEADFLHPFPFYQNSRPGAPSTTSGPWPPRSPWSCFCSERNARWSNEKKKGEPSRSQQMDVSENSGTPKSSILIGFSIINHPFWGIYTCFWKHPNEHHKWTCCFRRVQDSRLLEALEIFIYTSLDMLCDTISYLF